MRRREHVDKACEEMRRFKEQTDRDLREALVNYAVMQISMCKKVERRNTFPHPHHRLKLLPLAGNPGVEQCQRVLPEDVTGSRDPGGDHK